MAELKTKITEQPVSDFLNTLTQTQQKEDALKLHALFETKTKQKGVMWGENMIGYDVYTYTNTSGQHHWLLTGFSPRKNN